MLFHSSIRKELARSFGATLIVLATVVMTLTLIRTLGQASRGTFNPSDVMLVMGYTVLAYMPAILALSLFLATVATLSRLYRDSEMVIWFSSGTGLSSLLGPLYRFAWPILLVVAVLSLAVVPWSSKQVDDLKESYEKRGDVERISPGQFQESAGGTRVFFVDKQAADKVTGNHVFIAITENKRETLISADSGRIDKRGPDRFLMLNNGQRVESEVGKPELKVSQFQDYSTKADVGEIAPQAMLQANMVSTLDLLRTPTPPFLGELSLRVGWSLTAFNLVILALAIANVNPRVGRSGSLAFAFFAFVLYFNLLALGQDWIAGGKFAFAGFVLALHGGAFLFGIAWLAKRHNNWTLATLLRRHAATAAAAEGEAP
jgi:lipopolysaccharide export system permease protein